MRKSRGSLGPRGDLGDPLIPGRIRGQPEGLMDPGVIGADDFKGEIGFELSQASETLYLGIEIAPLAHVREMRAGNEMDGAHHRADQPLDMAAKRGVPGGR